VIIAAGLFAFFGLVLALAVYGWIAVPNAPAIATIADKQSRTRGGARRRPVGNAGKDPAAPVLAAAMTTLERLDHSQDAPQDDDAQD